MFQGSGFSQILWFSAGKRMFQIGSVDPEVPISLDYREEDTQK